MPGAYILRAFLLICIGAASIPLAAMADEPVLRLRVADADLAALSHARSLQGVRVVQDEGPVDLIWLAQEGSLITGEGEIAAEKVATAQLQAIMHKWNAVQAISAQAENNALALALTPEGTHHKLGTQVTFRSAPLAYPHVVVFNLSSLGDVQFLYPQDGDPAQMQPGSRYELTLRVGAPLGADHLAVVASGRNLSSLAKQLAGASVANVPGLLAEALAGHPHEIGVAALFAAPAD